MASRSQTGLTISDNSSPKVPSAIRRKRWRLGYESRIVVWALAGGTVGIAIALIFLWSGNYEPRTQWTLTLLIVAPWLAFGFGLKSVVSRPLQTLANMQAALREGDFSMRVRSARMSDSLGELAHEVNTLSEELRQQRLGALEATALLSKVMAEIDVAIFAFDSEQRLRVINRAGERLVGISSERALGMTAAELDLADCVVGESARTFDRVFRGASGRWGLRRSVFRQGGVPHQLLVISDLSRALREEERQAWQRLVRVLGHELNNSLAPIKSISHSLEELFRREPRAADWEEDMRRGLAVIADRSEALNRFMRDYSRLAKLPKPQLQDVDLGALVRRTVELESRMKIAVEGGPPVHLRADPDQLEQLLINVLRNAVDAACETGGGVSVSWARNGTFLKLAIEDEGPGIANAANLFVPFFTTKREGSGIGLALSRQIAEAHGGSLTLENREVRGCRARLILPLR